MIKLLRAAASLVRKIFKPEAQIDDESISQKVSGPRGAGFKTRERR